MTSKIIFVVFFVRHPLELKPCTKQVVKKRDICKRHCEIPIPPVEFTQRFMESYLAKWLC